MEDALNENETRIGAGSDALPVATCPSCNGIMVLRGRRTGRNPGDKNLVLSSSARGGAALFAVVGGEVVGRVFAFTAERGFSRALILDHRRSATTRRG